MMLGEKRVNIFPEKTQLRWKFLLIGHCMRIQYIRYASRFACTVSRCIQFSSEVVYWLLLLRVCLCVCVLFDTAHIYERYRQNSVQIELTREVKITSPFHGRNGALWSAVRPFTAIGKINEMPIAHCASVELWNRDCKDSMCTANMRCVLLVCDTVKEGWGDI